MYSIKVKATQVIISARFRRYWVSPQSLKDALTISSGLGEKHIYINGLHFERWVVKTVLIWASWLIGAFVVMLFPPAICLKKLGCQDSIAVSIMTDQCICGDAVSTCNLSQAHKQYKAMQRASLIIQCYARGWKVSDLSTFTLHLPPPAPPSPFFISTSLTCNAAYRLILVVS